MDFLLLKKVIQSFSLLSFNKSTEPTACPHNIFFRFFFTIPCNNVNKSKSWQVCNHIFYENNYEKGFVRSRKNATYSYQLNHSVLMAIQCGVFWALYNWNWIQLSKWPGLLNTTNLATEFKGLNLNFVMNDTTSVITWNGLYMLLLSIFHNYHISGPEVKIW